VIAARKLGPIVAVACAPTINCQMRAGETPCRVLRPKSYRTEPQREMPTLAMKEFEPQLAFELLNVLSECRLGEVKPLRRSSDVQRLGYFDEVP
jgi:hypothetical protein